MEGTIDGADGGKLLKIKVSAQPEKGKANKAVLKLLAKNLGLSASALEIVARETSRYKAILIRGDASILAEKLSALVK